jgi:hypothetical protein
MPVHVSGNPISLINTTITTMTVPTSVSKPKNSNHKTSACKQQNFTEIVSIKEIGFPDTCTGISVDQRNGISRYMYWQDTEVGTVMVVIV